MPLTTCMVATVRCDHYAENDECAHETKYVQFVFTDQTSFRRAAAAYFRGWGWQVESSGTTQILCPVHKNAPALAAADAAMKAAADGFGTTEEDDGDLLAPDPYDGRGK